MIYTQTDIIQKQVYLVEELGAAVHERMLHLKAIVFVRPTQANIRALEKELANPTYGEYHIFFSNVLPRTLLESVARADKKEVRSGEDGRWE